MKNCHRAAFRSILHYMQRQCSCFYHIRSFNQIRSSLDDGMVHFRRVCSLCTGFIASRSGKFHLVRRSFEANKSPSARPECAGKSRYLSASYTSQLSSTALLQNLHWLPIEWGVHFKLTTLAYKALHTGQPPYLSELLQHYEPTRTLRSSSSFQLSVPRYNLEFGSRAFRISAPKIWNLLPASIRNSPSLPTGTFRRHLKTQTHYFQSAYPNPY